MSGKTGGGGGSGLVAVILERSVAQDLLEALIRALGGTPNGKKKKKKGKKNDGKTGTGKKKPKRRRGGR